LPGGALAVAALAIQRAAGLGWVSVAGALLCYGGIALLVLSGLPHHAPHRRFGPANAVTALRAAYVALLSGIVMEGDALSPGGRWVVAAAGTAALVLDGVDGWAARRTGLDSPFGARFDMEVDALFVLVLSMLVYHAGQAGAWVLTSGLMRYMFVLAGRLWPPLAAPVPPRFRRKAICVVQIAVLILALLPALSPARASALCLGGLALLVYSFGADCVFLLTGRQAAGRTPT
jgi:phosphatidylglycerophosphate synthase